MPENTRKLKAARQNILDLGVLAALGLALIMIHGTPATAAPAAAQSRALIQRGQGEMQKGYYRSAVQTFQQALQAAPQSPEALLGLAQAYKRDGQFKLSVKYYEKLLKFEPDNRAALLDLSDIWSWEKETRPQAIVSLQHLIQIDPGNAAAHRLLGTILGWDESTLTDAQSHLRMALQLAPSDDQTILFLARVLNWSKQWDESEKLYLRYLEKHADPEAQIELAEMLSYTEARRPEAIASLQKLAAEHPDNKKVKAALANATLWQKSYPTAIEQLRALVKEHPADAKLRQQLGTAYRLAGDNPQALAEYDAVLQSEPGNLDAQMGRAAALSKLGHREEAAPIFERLSALLETKPEFCNEYGQCLLSLKRPGAAAAVYEKMLALPNLTASEKTAGHVGLAHACILEGKYDLCASHAEQALQLEPHNAAAIRLLTGAHLAAERLEQAKKVFAGLPVQDRGDYESLRIEADLARRSHDWHRARDIYKEMLTTASGDSLIRSYLGKALLEIGDLKGAETELVAALAKDSQDANIDYDLARTLALERRPDEAAKYLQDAIALSTADEQMVRAQEFSGPKRTRPLSILLCRAILAKDERSRSARFLLAKLLSWSPITQNEAVQQWERYLEIHGDDPAAKKELAEVLSWTEKKKHSLRLFATLQETQPGDVKVMIGQAKVLSWTGHLGKARSIYRQVLAKNPQEKEALVGLGQCASWSGDCFKAETYFERASKLETRDVEVETVLDTERAMNYRQMGRLDKAAASIAKAAALLPQAGEE